jgi:flagellar protein FliO/FliZ
MDSLLLVKFLSVFVFVIALMLLLSWGMKKIGMASASLGGPAKRRLKVVESLQLDHRRRLVIVRRDNQEHLLVLGHESEMVVEAGIPVADEDHVVPFSRDQRNVKI